MRWFRAQLTLTLVIFAVLPWPAGIAAAHGPAPAALSIVAAGPSGADVVRLTGGLARRVPGDLFRFVCPAAWGDEVVLPAATIPPAGPVVIAGSRGLFLLDAMGTVTMHPDPVAATGPATDFAVLGGKLFGLRTASGASELLEIDATRVRVVFSEPGSWSSIAATQDTIGIQRITEDKIEQLRLSAEGALLGRDSAPAPQAPILVLARATSRALYAVVGTASGRELGQIQGDKWLPVEDASSSIAGPVELPSGEPFVALDTELFRLPEPRVAFEGAPAVNCLGRLADRAYACTRDGLAALEQNGLGSAIFQLSSLVPPELQALPESQRDACETQWEHFRFDLLALGVTLVEPPVGAAGSGGMAGSIAGADVPTAAGGMAGSIAGASVPAAGAPQQPQQLSPAADSGCSCQLARSQVPLRAAWLGIAIVYWARVRRRSAERRCRATEQRAQ
jgi:hypothetical protein